MKGNKGRRSFAVFLTADIQETLDKKILEGRDTLDDMCAWLKDEAPDIPVSRSALNRYCLKRRPELGLHSGIKAELLCSDEAADLLIELARLELRKVVILKRLNELETADGF